MRRATLATLPRGVFRVQTLVVLPASPRACRSWAADRITQEYGTPNFRPS